MKQHYLTIDLHIEKIAKGYRNFSPADSFLYQTELFERTLIANRFQKGMKIDFVHGVGTGNLRSELLKMLSNKFPGYSHEDAPFAEYGYQGALRVTIR